MGFRSLLVAAGSITVALVGCTFLVQFDDRPGASLVGDAASDVKTQASTDGSADQFVPDAGPPDPCRRPNNSYVLRGAPVWDAGSLMVCCDGKITPINTKANCGGCGITCNFGGQSLDCVSVTGTSGMLHPYCVGCIAAAGGLGDVANSYCFTGLCSGTGDPAAGRCSPSNGGTACLAEVCADAGAKCGTKSDGTSIADPNYYCTYE